MSHVIDPHSIGHRVRCMVVHLGRVVRCPDCNATTFEGFRFDGRRDPLPGCHNLVDPLVGEDIDQLLDALLELGPLVERQCLQCAGEEED